jgi:hypothetical protein
MIRYTNIAYRLAASASSERTNGKVKGKTWKGTRIVL